MDGRLESGFSLFYRKCEEQFACVSLRALDSQRYLSFSSEQPIENLKSIHLLLSYHWVCLSHANTLGNFSCTIKHTKFSALL